MARPLVGLARLALAEHRLADAQVLAERALAIREAHDVGPDELADTRELVARIHAAVRAQGGAP